MEPLEDVSMEFASFLSHHDANALELSDGSEDGTDEGFDLRIASSSDAGSDSETHSDIAQYIAPKCKKKSAKQKCRMAPEKKSHGADEQDTYDPSACSKHTSSSVVYVLICVSSFHYNMCYPAK